MPGIIFKIGINFFVLRLPSASHQIQIFGPTPTILYSSPDTHQVGPAAPQGRSYLGCLFGHRCQGSNEMT